MSVILIWIYVLLNVFFIVRYFRIKSGTFQAPFLMAGVSLGVLLPQLTTYYLSPVYDNELLYLLLFVMITGNASFVYGFERGKSRAIPKSIMTLNMNDTLVYLNLFFAILGCLSVLIYRDDNSDFVIGAFLKAFAQFSFFTSLILVVYYKPNTFVYLALILSFATIFNFAFLVKGSRSDSLLLGLAILLFLNFYKGFNKKVKYFTLGMFLFGAVFSASITMIRNYIKDGEAFGDSFYENFTESFSEDGTEQTLGMDIANAAKGIAYCWENMEYDYGLQLWNGFVYNFVPKRLVGEDIKNSLTYENGYTQKLPTWTHGVTTMTGYASAFASFSVFSFLFFFAVGYIYGWIWKYSAYSTYYLLLYFWQVTWLHAFFSHGMQLFFGRLESFFIFLFPILILFGCLRQRKMVAKRSQARVQLEIH
ncbi:hypothetical protein [Sphingobacterium paludis]|uniref:Oligosaccharide repeat unit polymerase n=1 Tax=Sphingobacterium paludis TaxID=1476465 RepID=A0A4R7CZD5_9SPHI|nr:hypothetical protein [Sphingobacterium paludis]TDS13730.1 hypothetical protein B0I21_10456 [Sphingobacterium paludis]